MALAETLADLIAAEAPPAPQDKLWERIRRSLVQADPRPVALDPALTLVSFQVSMAKEASGRRGGFGEFFALARNRGLGPRLPGDLASVGFLEAAALAQEARDLFDVPDEAFDERVLLETNKEDSRVFMALRDVSQRALGQDYDAAAWTALQSAADAARAVPAASEKRGLWGRIFPR